MTPLDAYHIYAARFNFAPTINPPADLCAATLPYVLANAKQTQTAATRQQLRLHRAAQANVPDLFALHPSPGQLARATGLPIAAAHEQLAAYRRARGLKPPKPLDAKPTAKPPKPSKRTPIPAYVEPPGLDPADPLADYHARIGEDPGVRLRTLCKTLCCGDDSARRRYRAWCDAHNETPKTSPNGPARPWQPYALARLSEGYPFAEIAAAIGVTVDHVKGLKVTAKDP